MRLVGLMVILAVAFLLLRMFKGGGGLATRICRHCGQQIPAIGAFCPICGERVV